MYGGLGICEEERVVDEEGCAGGREEGGDGGEAFRGGGAVVGLDHFQLVVVY